MPYKSISELPASVRNTLPVSALRIWMNAYNYAIANPDKVEGEPARYAWGAVKKVYEKRDGKWVKKNNLDLSVQEIEDLQLTTADIVDILPKRFWEVPVRYGYRVASDIGRLLWNGLKSTFTSSVSLDDYVGQPIHLIEDVVSYGTFILKKSVSKRKDEDEEDEFDFYVYEIDWLRKFPGPLPVRVRKKEYGLLDRKDYSFKMLSGLSNRDLLYIHSYCHSGHHLGIKEFHDLVAKEMERRGIIHPVYAPMDKDTPEIPAPDIGDTPQLDIEDKVTLEQFLSMLPDQFSLDAPPPKMWVTGDIVNKGITTISDGIDIVVGQDEVDPRIISKIASLIGDDRVKKSIRVIFSTEGPPFGYSIPLYRDAFQKLSYRSTFNPTDYLRYTRPSDNTYTNLQTLWDEWGSVRIDDGLFVEKRYDGIPVSVHHFPGSRTIIRKNKVPLKLDSIELELSKIDRQFVGMGTIVQYDCNNIKVNKIEELCKPIPAGAEKLRKKPFGYTHASDCTVLHLHEIVFLDNTPIHNGSYKERVELMDSLIPDDLIHVRKVPYSLVKSKAELESAVSQLLSIGSDGVNIKEATSTFNFSGKSKQMVDLDKDSDVIVIKLKDCTLFHDENICPLYTLTHHSLTKVAIEELQYPVKCQLASLVKCPLVKDYYYQLSKPVEIKNWFIPLTEPDPSDTHTPLNQSDQPYRTYTETGGLS